MYVMYHTSEVPGVAQKRGNDGCGDRKSLLALRREQQQCRKQECSLPSALLRSEKVFTVP